MKKNLFIGLVMAIALVVAFGVTPAMAKAKVHSVNGGGSIEWPYTGGTTLAVTAQIDEDGIVKGMVNLQFHDWLGVGTWYKVNIDCLVVVDNTAWLSGIIVKASDPYYEGRTWAWQVQDNGEGKNASAPDMLSFIQYDNPPFFCIMTMDMGLFEWTNGNVQVK